MSSVRLSLSACLLLSVSLLCGCSQHRGVEIARAQRGMVVAGHPQAAEIGIQVLRARGNAMDAAVAVSMSLGVAEPYGSGLGGKLMMLYLDAASGLVMAIDAMDQASSTFDVDRFAARSYEQRVEGWAAVAVPGLLAGLHTGHQRWGRLPWSEVVLPAAQLARSGARVLPATRSFFERRLDRIRVSPEASQIYLPDGDLPAVGHLLVNLDLARTLEWIADHGADGFYRGPVAEAIAAASQAGGGSLTLADLASYRARVIEPLVTEVLGVTVYSAPPPATGGVTLLTALRHLADGDFGHRAGEGQILDAESLDQIGQTLRRIYPEIQARIGDVPTARAAFEELIQSSSTTGSMEVAESETGVTAQRGLPLGNESTTHFVVVDGDGNVASVTQSLSHHFGAGVVAPTTGVLFNNTLKNFEIEDRNSVNFAAPAKRPRSTIAPTLVFRDQRPILALGIPGGQRIPTATLQVLLDHLAFGSDLAASIERPRAHLRRPLRDTEPDNVFELEASDSRLAAALEQRGWASRVSEDNEVFGGFCAVEILPDYTLVGVADLRRTNAARGW